MIELSKPVITSLESSELDSIQHDVAEEYGVEVEDVNIELVYQTTGSLIVDIPTNADEFEIAQGLEDEISALLGIHEANVEVTIDNGVATYIITSDTAEDATEVQNVLQGPDVLSTLDEALPIAVTSVRVDNDIVVDVVITVDTTGAENNLNDSATALEDSFEEIGFIASAESKYEK